MTTYPEQGSASIEVNAAPEIVWRLIADITRMGEWSPECVKAEWDTDSTGPTVDAHFTGHNKIGDFEWSVPCIVTQCEPGSRFEFAVPRGNDVLTHWRFDVAPTTSGGTLLTESFTAPMINVEGSAANFEGRYEMLIDAIGTTIANVKAAAEQ